MRVYTFGNGTAEGDPSQLDLLGGKGAGLAGMSRLDVPVPPGFTVPTDVCRAFYEGGQALPEELWRHVERGLQHIEALRGRKLGDAERPLLVSVRSGARVSMPGMMDTVLNVGLNDVTLEVLGRAAGNRRFALDSYRRFIEMYVEVAMGLDPSVLGSVREEVLEACGARTAHDLPDDTFAALLQAYRRRVEEQAGEPLPDDPRDQIRGAVAGVFRSWSSRRAVQFRRSHGILDELGTAATVQAMVFGNLGDASGTGVAFTRDPNTGEARLFGEYLPDAQGEDVVSGAFTPYALAEVDRGANGEPLGAASMETRWPDLYAQLEQISRRLERALGDVQDVEFTIEDGAIWMLQTRNAKRSARAAVRVAVEMAYEGMISEDEAVRRVEPERLARLLHASVDVHARRKVIARGLPASPGAVSGIAVFDPHEAVHRSADGERVILVRVETSTEDLEAIRASAGVLTARGGMTSHAALVARGIGRTAVTGCADLLINERAGRLALRNQRITVESGAWITLDGSTGEVILGEVATLPADPPPAYHVLMGWADARRRLEVRANADSGADARTAFEYGADGVGLCRTEHMFLHADRVHLVREMVFAQRKSSRSAVVENMLPLQRADFHDLLEAAGERPLGIRLLDIPLHDFMPEEREDLAPVAEALDVPVETLEGRARLLHAANPVMGHRGARLGLTFPEVYEIQVRALIEAQLDTGSPASLQIIVPLVSAAEEMKRLRRRIDHIARKVCEERGAEVPAYAVGPMVETPRACLIAEELAESSDFFLFGTNDLTQAVFCLYRDDGGRYLPFYLENEVLPADPFVKLDQVGVGGLIEQAIGRARARKPGLLCGMSGAQVADPDCVKFSHDIGIDYLTCASHRVPIARLADARAALGKGALR